MTYVENIFLLVATPLIACLLVVDGRQRMLVASLLSGMLVCLLSSYVSAFFVRLVGADALAAVVEVAPVVEEAIKVLPLMYYLLVLEPSVEDADLAAVFIALGFATMESAFYLGEYGTTSPMMLAMRGLSSSMMHLTCGVVMGYGLRHVWEQPWLQVTGTFALLSMCVVFHGLFNLLVVLEGYALAVAVAMPLMTLLAVLAFKRRERSHSFGV